MVVDPVRRCRLPICKLACLHLTHNYRPSVNEFLDRQCVDGSGRVEAVVSAVAIAGFDAGDVVDVFDPEPDARERFVGGFCVVQARWDAHGWGVDAGNASGEGGVGVIAGGNQGLGECACKVGVESVGLVEGSL